MQMPKSVLVVFLFLSPLTAHPQVTIYQQPQKPYGGGLLSSTYYPELSYDNFTLTDSAYITSVSWDGTFGANVTVAPGIIDHFVIAFYYPYNQRPEYVLYATSIPGSANATLQSPTWMGDYHYSAELPSAFLAKGGQTYWISIAPSLTTTSLNWYWLEGTGGDGLCLNSYNSGTFYNMDLDFTLSGTPVPEPAEWGFVCIGCMIITARCRRMGQPAVSLTRAEEALRGGG